ncbi:dephospho-CoA kinase [Lactobacillus hamsteri]|uniref:Dephospho-CoA kinase n=1 Tax=Lactobacillus hamsteri DSM 5661 = JCM 6256 TaxID=1423754 RepID=A0A0R1Y6A5_9LACO|nr:dephospho-CoA kinase [Lactobacillus hamsteri]KRM37943.1 dephospho-coa kinase [Lactobacillus hamsteri DSM 5661 = JCM 6256]
MTLVLGLTGGIATGKSTADEFFEKKKIPVIDADKIAHGIYDIGKPAWKKIRDEFGEEYLNSDQTVNRKKLGQLVFTNKSKLMLLNEITHPLILEEIQAQINIYKIKAASLIIVDMPVLFESGAQKYCDQTLVITIPQNVQIERLMARNSLTKQEAIDRIHSQMPLSEKEAKATYVVSNIGTKKDLENKLEKLLLEIEAEV